MQRAAFLLVSALLFSGCATTQPETPLAQQARDPRTDTLLLHVHSVDARPTTAAVAAVDAQLDAALPLHVTWKNQTVDTQERAWTTQKLVRYSDQAAAEGAPVGRPTDAHLHVLWVPGSFPDERGVPLGVFVRPEPIVAVFHAPLRQVPAHIEAVATNVPESDHVEATVLLHQVLHALGMVGCGLPAVETRGESCHSDDPGSILHSDWGHLDGWITRGVRGASLEPRITSQDAADLAGYG